MRTPVDWIGLGRRAMDRGDHQEALNIFRRAMDAGGGADGYVGYAQASRALGDIGAARWAFNKAVTLDASYTGAAQALEAVIEETALSRPSRRPRASLFRASADYLEVNDGGWRRFFVKGVNLGLGIPGFFPGEYPIKKGTYLKWFAQMAAAGINSVRVYTVHPPGFYEALSEFNAKAKRKVYLFQGVWVENPEDGDFLGAGFLKGVEADIKEAVDAVFGSITLPERPGRASGEFTSDVSAYTAGFIFGREWESCAVKGFNEMRGRVNETFDGQHLRAASASPFAAWIARMCDHIQAYSASEYGAAHPVSTVCWPTLDPLVHPSESDYEDELGFQGYNVRTGGCSENEDMETLDVSVISAKKGPGFFATYHVYPYYPDFLNHDYLSEKDPYGTYLKEIKKHHGSQPVLLAEFGVPSSREVTHWHRDGWHQGGHNEEAQGEINGRLMKSIHSSGMAGGMLFSWFDEWFKRNWVFFQYERPAERNQLWFNLQDAEQNYGLVAAYPGYPSMAVTLSGEKAEWDGAAPLYDKGSGPRFSFGDGADATRTLRGLKAIHDEGFLYLRLELAGPVDFSRARYLIGIDTVAPETGEFALPYSTGARSPVGLKFLFCLTGERTSRILACRSYDKYLNMNSGVIRPVRSDDGAWVVMQNRVNSRRISKDRTRFYPSHVFSMSALRHGTLDGKRKNNDSLSDFHVSGNAVEIRLPWGLLNFTDPSSRSVLWKDETGWTRKTDGVRVVVFSFKPASGGTAEPTGNGANITDSLPGRLAPGEVAAYSWDGWDTPVYHTYLKKSYHAFKRTLSLIPE